MAFMKELCRFVILATVAALAVGCGTPPQANEPALRTEGCLEQPLFSSPYLKWAMNPSGVVEVPYEYANTGGVSQTVYDNTRAKIRHAMDHWEQYVLRPNGSALLRFVPHSGETRFVKFNVANYGQVCSVALKASGATPVESDPACRWQTYVHEVGHVLTFHHEQTRRDRPGSVDYFPLNGSHDGQFAMSGGTYLTPTYDSHSIMHYPSCMFALAKCENWTSNTWVLARNTCTANSCKYIKWWSDLAVGDPRAPATSAESRRCTASPALAAPRRRVRRRA